MPEYDNENKGVLFKNERKESENQPDYTGTVNVGGVDKDIAAWIKTSKDGTKKFLSLKVSEPRPRQNDSGF